MRFILVHGCGCPVDKIPGSTLALLNGKIRSDVDITTGRWIDTVKEAWEEGMADATASSVGISHPDATQNGFVPRSLVEGGDVPAPDLKAASGLPRHADLFTDPEKAPTVVAFFGEYGVDAATISQALAYMQDRSASASGAALWRLEDNNETWTQWVRAEAAEHLDSALSST